MCPPERIESSDGSPPAHRGELAFVGLVGGIGVVGWIAVALAETGRFGAVGLLVMLPAALVTLWWAAGSRVLFRPARSEAAPPATHALETGPRRLVAATGFCLVLVIAVVEFLPPFESVLWASDATVYLAFGHELAETGALRFEDPVLARIPSPAREEMFRNPEPADVTGRFVRFPGGFLIPDVERPEVTAGFAPLFPALLAVAWTLSGRAGALHVAPLCALLSVAAICLVGRRLAGWPAGLLAGTLVAVSLPQTWFAQLSMAEVVAQLFVFAGLLALLVSKEVPRLALAGGALFGLAMFAKFELVAMLPVAVAGMVAIALWSEPAGLHRRVRLFSLPFFVLLTHNLVHYLVLPSHYGPFVRRQLQELSLAALVGGRPDGVPDLVAALAIGAVVALAGLTWLLLARAERGASGSRGWAIAIAVMIGAYAFAYMAASTNRFAETLPWLGWYLSWPVVGAFLVAAALVVWRPPANDRSAALFLLVLVGVAAFLGLYDPQEPARQIWSVRRLVPVVLPGMLLMVATGLAAATASRAPRRRAWLAVPIAVVLVGLVARPGLGIAGPRPWAGALEATESLARLLPADSVVMVSPELSGTHLATALDYLYDRDAIILQVAYRDPSTVEDLMLGWLRSGRGVYMLLGDRAPHLAAPRLRLWPLADPVLDLPLLEETTDRRPERSVRQRRQLHLFRAGEGGAKHSVDVGSLADDMLFAMSGFHAPERDQLNETFRWTGRFASVDLGRAGERIRAVVAGDRPAGAPPARISVRINGRLVVEELAVDDAPATIVFDNPGAAGGNAVLAIESTVFRPRGLSLSEDDRELGVKVYRIEY